ncbi:MAG TPA: DUF4388 domain-containing protein [Holophagaceae bacterium]|nr:DUF4388 domain-containing protein [Holophagaceae bacterium]
MSLPALQDLFHRHREGHSGVWRLGIDPQRTIYLEKGQVIFAQSTHPLDKLTTLLVERGKLTQAQLDYALQNLKPGVSIGRNLIEMGFITQRDLLEVARAQVERVVWGAMGTPDDSPVFEPREMDASIVRLPLDTPFLLLMGALHITDRERLLQVLGPLEQRPDLGGRSLPEMALPQDLARVPALLDGQSSLLDLAREAGAEPMRLGAFALFLREMGLIQLKMGLAPSPPAPSMALALEPLFLDTFAHPEPPTRPAPEPPLLALEPFTQEPIALESAALEPEALPSIALEVETPAPPAPPPPPAPTFHPEPIPAPSPLVAAIEAAQRPTVNLDHLSKALDSTGELPEVLDAGAELPSPTETLRSPVPVARIRHAQAAGSVRMPPVAHPYEAFPDDSEAPKRRSWVWILLLILLGVGAWGGFRWNQAQNRPPAPKAPTKAPAPIPAHVDTPKAPSAPVPGTPQPGSPKAEAPKPEPPKPESKASVPAPLPVSGPLSAANRLRTLQSGNWSKALEEGKAHRSALPRTHWTLRLEIACQTETLARAVSLFNGRQADLFLLPISLRNGQSCTQVYLGDYASEGEAKQAIEGLPAPFREPGARPKPYPVGAIPDRQ